MEAVMEKASEREKRRAAMLDKLAAVLEQVGFPHGMAKVYAALTLADGEGLSTGELVEELGISKASVSNAMQFLVGTDLIERYRVRGSREAHYRILKGRWGDILARKFAATSYVRSVAEDAMTVVESPAARERLEDMRDVYAFFEQEFENVMERFNERTGR
jgi:DNA-binding transcriptional regulator GbsR (MarR family)